MFEVKQKFEIGDVIAHNHRSINYVVIAMDSNFYTVKDIDDSFESLLEFRHQQEFMIVGKEYEYSERESYIKKHPRRKLKIC